MIKIAGTFPKLLVLVGICFLSGGLFAILGMSVAGVIFDIPILEMTDLLSDSSDSNNIRILKFLQLFNTIGLFIIPAIIYPILFIEKPKRFLGLDKKIEIQIAAILPLLFLTYLPIINWLVEINQTLSLPAFLSEIESWMKNTEEKAKILTEAFLQMNSTSDLMINILLIGVLPAIGEELIFRGIIQKTINKNQRNYHIGIWVAAFLFSALHMQFYGFLPRMVLGAFFGYLFVWTGSIWAPILAHFINNASAVILSYFYGSQSTEIDEIGTKENAWLITGASILVFSFLIYYLKKSIKKPPQEEVV